MLILSTAKINLFLDITGKDHSDGYHFIDSLFQEITLADEIVIEKSDADEVRFINAGVSGITTVHSALSNFKKKFNISDSYRITILKRIPIGAGLGGGSSNAA